NCRRRCLLLAKSRHPASEFRCPLLGLKRISGWRALRIICVLSASRDRAHERAGDPLHSGRVNAKALGNPTHALTGALTLVQGVLDSLLKLGGYSRPTQSFALVLGTPKPSADSFCDHRAFKLGKNAHHLKHRLAARRRGVQALLVQEQVDMEGVQLR